MVQGVKFWYSEQSIVCFYKIVSSRDPNFFLRNYSLKPFDHGLQPLQNMIRIKINDFRSCNKNKVVRSFGKVLSRLFNLQCSRTKLFLLRKYNRLDFSQNLFSWTWNRFWINIRLYTLFLILAPKFLFSQNINCPKLLSQQEIEFFSQ